MSSITKEAALARAEEIRDETADGANTATRVGGLLVDLVDSTAFGSDAIAFGRMAITAFLVGTVHDLTAPDLADANTLLVQPSAAGVIITGIVDTTGLAGRVLLVQNASNVYSFYLANDQGSAPANRLRLPTYHFEIPPQATILLQRDWAGFWRPASFEPKLERVMLASALPFSGTNSHKAATGDVEILVQRGIEVVDGRAIHGEHAPPASGSNGFDLVVTGGDGDGAGNPGNIDVGDSRIRNLADPVDDQDAVTKAYLASLPGPATPTLEEVLGAGSSTGIYDIVLGESMALRGGNSPAAGFHARIEGGFATAAGNGGDVIIIPGAGTGGGSIHGRIQLGGLTNLNDFGIINLADPVDPQDAATKAYVDAHSGGTGGGETFAETLAIGNETGGANILLTKGSSLLAEKAASYLLVSYGGDSASDGGGIGVQAQNGTTGGVVEIIAGNALAGSGGGGGNVLLSPGAEDGAGAPGVIACGIHRITDVADPADPQDAATKAYVDAHTAGGAPLTAEYLVGKSDGALSAERVVTDTPTLTWDLTTAGQAKAAVPANAVTNLLLRDSSPCSVVGRAANSVGDPADIPAGADDLVLCRAGGTLDFRQISTATVANNAITNAKQATVASGTIKGRATAGPGNVEDLTGTQATALLDTFTSTLKGLAPASGGGTANFLRADGTWAAAGGGSLSTNNPVELGTVAPGSGTAGSKDDHVHPTTLTNRGSENLSLDLLASGQTPSASVATTGTQTSTVPITTSRVHTITATVFVKDGSENLVFLKTLLVIAYRKSTGGAIIQTKQATLDPNSAVAGHVFDAAVSTNDIVFTYTNTTGGTLTVSTIVGQLSLDMP